MNKNDWVVDKSGYLYKVSDVWSNGLVRLMTYDDEEQSEVVLKQNSLRKATSFDFDKVILNQQARLVNIESFISQLEIAQKDVL